MEEKPVLPPHVFTAERAAHNAEVILDGWKHRAHGHRRDGHDLELVPMPAQVHDYAAALNHIDAALLELNEGLPAGQSARVGAGFMLLRAGVEELAVWLRTRGVVV